jgi:hypothetical protein
VLGSVNAAAGSIVTPGIGGIGDLVVQGALTLGGTFRCDIIGGASDQLSVGTIVLTGATLVISENQGTAFPYTILTYTPGGRVGTFANAPSGYTLDYSTDGIIRINKTLAGYSAWAQANALGETMGQDHNHDGVPNGIKYFTGLSGSESTAAGPTIDSNLKVSWPRAASYAGVYGTDYKLQTSLDLVNWTDVPALDPALNDGSTLLEYALDSDQPRSFIRLVVTGP